MASMAISFVQKTAVRGCGDLVPRRHPSSSGPGQQHEQSRPVRGRATGNGVRVRGALPPLDWGHRRGTLAAGRVCRMWATGQKPVKSRTWLRLSEPPRAQNPNLNTNSNTDCNAGSKNTFFRAKTKPPFFFAHPPTQDPPALRPPQNWLQSGKDIFFSEERDPQPSKYSC